MQNFFDSAYRNIVLGKPKTILFFLFCIFFISVFHAKDFKLDASADSLLLENDEDLKIFREVNERYKSLEFLFITFTPNEELFSEATLDVIRALREDLSEVSFVDSVVSLIDVPLVRIAGGKLSEVVNKYQTLEQPGVDLAHARQELLESPVYSSLIISPDGQTIALIVNLKPYTEYFRLQNQRNQLLTKKRTTGLSNEENGRLEQILHEYDYEKDKVDLQNKEGIRQLRELMENYKEHGVLHLGGVPMIANDMISFIRSDLIIFGFGVFVFLVGMLSIIFRQPRWVVLPLLSCIYSGLIMIGLLGMIGWRVTVISSNFVSLMLILTMSMNIHLIVRFRELQRDRVGANQAELVMEMVRKMVRPCLYTALTTMIGFSSLFISDIKPVIDFGWMMTIGLGVTFATTFLLFPTVLILLKKAEATGSTKSSVPLISFLASITEKHGNKILIASLGLALISVLGIMQLKVENSFIDYFSEDTEIYQGQLLIDEKLGGTNPLELILKFDTVEDDEDVDDEFDSLFGEIETDKADNWFTSSKIEQIKQVHDYLDSQPEIGKVLSLASFVRLAEELNQGQEFEPFELAVIYKRMPEDMKATMLSPYISIEHDEARISMRILDSQKELRRKELLDRIERALQLDFELQPEQFQLTGLLVLYNNMLQSLFQSQILTLGVVMLGIALMLLVLFRSFPLAVVGILPNILAAAIILGLMGLANIPLDMMTITIAAITIGIAVDDCIHYIYRFREEFPRHNKNYVETLHYCHRNIGRAMFYTSLTVIIGFSILVLSNFIPTIYFGVLTTLAMMIALLAALTLLPRLILLLKPF